MKTNRLFAVFLALLLAVLCSARGLAAGKGPSLEIDPLFVQRVVAGGSQLSYRINVENQDPLEFITLEAAVADIGEDFRGSYTLLPAGSTSYSLARWISLSPARFTIPPGQSQQIDVTISVPRGISGGRYGAVTISTVPRDDNAPAGAFAASTIRFHMASFIELVVQVSAERKEAYAESFNVEFSQKYPELRMLVGNDALVFTASVKNESNVHIVAKGSLIISTIDGRTIAKYPLGGGRGVIIPEATVGLRSVITSVQPPGEYIAKAVIDYGARRPIVAQTKFVVHEGQVVVEEATDWQPHRFAVLPDPVEITLRPGSTRSAVVEVVNNGEEDLVLSGQVLPLAYDALGTLLPSEDRAGGLDWITVSPQVVRVSPGMSSRVRVTARAPEDASGGYYADIVFTTEGSALQTESGSSLLVFVGDSEEDAIKRGSVELVQISVEPGALSADAWFTNEGNVHVNIDGELFLFGIYPEEETEGGLLARSRQEQVASAPIDGSTNPVLPGTGRLLRSLIPAELEDGQYELAIRVDYGGDEPAIGRLQFRVEGGIVSGDIR